MSALPCSALLVVSLAVAGQVSAQPGPLTARGALPHLRAARLISPPVVDGRLDDAAWRGIAPTEAFWQKFPDEGRPPAERTIMRIAYDDAAVYVAFDCEQRSAPVNARLTRRDRSVESDWVSVAIDTRRDGKSAFEFTVNAAGVLIDSIHFNDTEVSADWDENWDARATTTPQGWSAELRIPLRILRFTDLPVQDWGFQARRYVSHRQETDEWTLIPRSSAGEVSLYGKLDELRGLKSGGGLEVSPFVLGKLQRRDRQEDQLSAGRTFALSAGLDLKWHPSQELTVDATVNPDFAQVEADQVVLNLTNFETNYPEKRRFFLEGIDTFTTPIQVLYTRRIGRAAPAPVLGEGEQLVEQPRPAPIYGALKVTGQLGRGWELGALSGLTGRNDVEVQRQDGTREARLVDPLTLSNVLRLKKAAGGNGYVGLIATSVSRFEPTGQYPIREYDPVQAEAYAACPQGVEVVAGQRCFNDAYTGGVDWNWRSSSGDYSIRGQALGSLTGRGPERSQPDGTILRSGDPGAGYFVVGSKQGGEHWLWTVWSTASSRKFEINDLGYNERGNHLAGGGELSFRTLQPWSGTLETSSHVEAFARSSMSGLPLERVARLDGRARFKNFWVLSTGFHLSAPGFDDREVGDGSALERAGRIGHDFNLTTDPRGRVSGHLGTVVDLLAQGVSVTAEAGLTVRAFPQLDIEVLPQVLYTRGEPRYAGTTSAGHLFGRLEARSLGALLRSTYTFTPRLTMQGYAQLFLASKHYSDFSTFDGSAAGPRPTIHLTDLVPAAEPTENPDSQQGTLDFNVVLRWEFRPGALLYLVYTHAQAANLKLSPGEPARLDFISARRGPAIDTMVLKLSYWWG